MVKDFKLRYNPALDGLRGVAILLVILSHSHAPLFDGAFFGVDLFFVLSGYLITSLLLMENDSEGRIGFWRFYRRRFFRQDEPPPEIERGSDTAPDEGTRP